MSLPLDFHPAVCAQPNSSMFIPVVGFFNLVATLQSSNHQGHAAVNQSDIYPPRIAELVRAERLSPLGPGNPNEAVRGQLAGLSATALFSPQVIGDENMAAACLAGLWLYHDFLDEAHTLSQDIATPSGSYWHGLMHRREQDFGNLE